ncbi:FAD-dependent urate hydroxylase [Phycisphaerales bacterium]|nr:FAD-dependent urate hydroxylase [Phycisphaerales bacterium]
MRVLIIGGGIGGLAAAAALRARGERVSVYEKSREYRDGGCGMTIWPNGMLALRRLGLDSRIADAGWPITQAQIRRPDGDVISVTPVEQVSRLAGAPTIAVHRAALQRTLADPGIVPRVHFGKRCTGVLQEDEHVAAFFEDGTAARGDLLLGADGLWSSVRDHVTGPQTPRHLGHALWRGVVSIDDPSLAAGCSFETWDRGARFGMVQIDSRRAYWYAGLSDCPTGTLDMVRPALLERFGGWHSPIRAALVRTPQDQAVRTEIYDRPVPSRWHRGRVVLLGDAAHAMTHDLGQGACTAIEDAVALADCIAGSRDLNRALAWYQRVRRARCARLSAQSRRITRICQLSSPLLCWARDTVTRLTPPNVLARGLRRTIGLLATPANPARSSPARRLPA